MPGTQETIERIREKLNKLLLTLQDSSTDWTKGINTTLCELGHELGYQVGAKGLDFGYGEWLYDVTWLEYSRGYQPSLENRLLDVHLVAECEWGNRPNIKDDFEKLLLARASVRLMIYDGNYDPGSAAIAKSLEEYVRGFRRGHPTDVWLLAAWERDADAGTWSFRYFPLGRLTKQQELF